MMTRINFNYQSADEAGEHRHAQTVMTQLSTEQDFKIISGEAHPIGDCWLFVIEHEGPIKLPEFIKILPAEVGP